MAEWARLLSECWVKPVAGSNPALPATKQKHTRKGVFLFSSRESPLKGWYSNPALPPHTKRIRNGCVFVFQS